MDSMDFEEKFTPGKRKKKRSFLTNIKKKFAKSRDFARGNHIEEDTYQYFIRVLELERQEFDSLDDKKIFVNNALDQTMGHEVDYSSNQLVSRVLENLLSLANETSLMRFLEAFGKDLRPICSDMFASHILQKLLVLATKQVVSEGENSVVKQKGSTFVKPEPGSHSYECYKWVIKVGRFILNNLEDLVWDRIGNHIIRTVFYCLSGSPDSGKDNKQLQIKKTDLVERFTVPDEFSDLFREYINRLMSWPQFSDFASNELTSGMLQVSLKALKPLDSKLNKKIILKLLTEVYYPYNVDGTLDVTLFEKSPVVHLLECIIESCGNKLYSKLYAKCFVNNLSTLAKMRVGSFTVQKLINRCSEKTDLECIFDELCPHFSDILKCQNTGVLLSLCQASERLGAKQMDFIKGLSKTLNLESDEHQDLLAMHIIKMVPFKSRTESEINSLPISLHGSLILQSMLKFKKPIKVVNSLLSINPALLCNILCDLRGSHISDAFVTAEFVGEKSRERLVRHLKGFYVKMAVSKPGSRAFDKIWETAGIKNKMQMTTELSSKESELMSTDFGKFVALKTALSTFRHNREEWKSAMTQNDKTKKLFADIVGDSAVK